MKVLLINIDSKLTNFALAKIEMYHKLNGDEIIYDNDLFLNIADKIYVSCIFTCNKEKTNLYEHYNAIIGGTGYNNTTKLPNEIENLKPKINLGFTTRGCIRKCSFCFVPEKEGKIHIVGDLYDLWDGKSKIITIMDNNITALENHFITILKQAQKEKIKLDFNQGIDFRLLNENMIYEMKKTSLVDIRVALDNESLIKPFNEKLKILRKYYPKTAFFVYVFANNEKGTDWDSTMKRLLFLKENGCRPYLMRHEDVKKDKMFIKLARWTNQQHLFVGKTWEQFLDYDKHYNDKPIINNEMQTTLF